jgi:nuclear pore complex protein Nup160
MASITNQRGILDVAFTVSRDKKLRLWSLHRDKLINSFDLSQLLASSSAEHGSATEALYSDHQQPLVRVVLSTSLADQHAAYLILYTAQSGLANAFLIFAITLNDSGEVDALVPLGSKTVPDSLAAAELVDFQIAHVNPALAVPTPTWVLWTQWQIAGAQHLVFIPLSEISTGTMQITQGEEAEDQWMPVLPSFEDGWSAEAFEERLAAQAADGQIGQEDVSRVFVKHIFEPARYAPSTLVAAYESYAASLESLPDFDELASVADRIVETVGYSVQLVSSTTTGAPLVDDYIAELKSEWLRFLALLNESKAAALFPLALSCDPRTLTVYAHSRNAITVPVVQDEALTLQRRVEHVAGETDEGFLTIAERTFHSSYPHLASMTTRRPILQLASIARTLWAVLPAEVALEIETQLVATVCSPLVLAAEDVTTDLYDRLLQDSLVDHRDALLSQMQEVPNLTEGLGTYLQLLASGDWAGFPESTVEEGLPTKLGTSLATSTVQQGAKARYTAVLELLVLLLAAYAEEDSLFPSSSQQLNAAFSCFHSLHLLKWITECIEPPVARADPDTSTEILAKRFGDLGMQHKQADRAMAWSLLNSLLSDPKYMPLLSAAPATSLIQAASSFLGYLELLPAAAQIDTKDGLVVLAYRLLEFGLPQQALDLVHKLPQNEGLAYEAGRALLQIGQPDEAASFVIRASIALEGTSCFKFKPGRADTRTEPEALTSLATIVPQQLCSAIPFFYHSALLFSEQADTEAAVARLCSAAIDHIERGQSTAEDTVKDLWSLLFKSQVETGDFDLAFSTLVDIPLADL